MKILSTEIFKKSLEKVKRGDSNIEEKIKSKLEFMTANPKHPSLRLHKLSGKQSTNWSISIQSNIRIIFTYSKVGIVLLRIGTHDEAYR